MASTRSDTATDGDGRVSRRAVLYIPGYDPFPARRYRELYRSEGAAQARISGYDLRLLPGTADGAAWQVAARMDGAEVDTRVEVLVWSDLVRQSMDVPIPVTYWLLLRTLWTYLASGALWRLARLRTGPLVAALLPVVVLIGQLVMACGAGLAARHGVLVLAGWVWPGSAAATAVAALGWATAALAAWRILRWCKANDHRVFAYYLLHDYAFFSWRGGCTPPELRGRLAHFADRIAAALSDEVDEVLVVGHSSGAHLAVSALAAVLRDGHAAGARPTLSLLTLGQVIPMHAFLPGATGLRSDLRALSCTQRITWLDVSAPGDGCCYALCDPVAVSGATPAQGKRWPLVISAAFSRTLTPARLRALRHRHVRLHMQYLCAFDRPGDYDYFRITAGPLTLGARFAGRAPSPSRVEARVSPYPADPCPASA